MQDVKTMVRKFIDDNFMMGGDLVIADDTSFMKEHILDSTGFLELITFIEEAFKVSVADQEMLPANFDSLNNIDAYLKRKLAVGA